MVDVRKKAAELLEKLPPYPKVVTSDGATGELFKTLTGSTHAWLQQRWAVEDVAKQNAIAENRTTKGLPTTTTCNGLAGQVGAKIGAPIALGQFDIEKKLKAAGLADAWVPANSGKKPGYGDVFKPKAFHMGVSLDFDGDVWNTAESGQGGPGADYRNGRDIVKRKKDRPFDPATLEGWVDIEILMTISAKAPVWMRGWWRFEANGAKEFVWLPERGKAQSFDKPPTSVKLPPPTQGKPGDIAYDADNEGVTIVWSLATTDRLRHLPGVEYMLGERGGAQIQAFKLH